jgi:hypothetical protein
MRRILIAAVTVAALVQAGAASAGCMATVGLGPPPTGIAPGATWRAEMTVLQHGINPLPNAATAQPTLTIVNAETGERRTFTGRPTKDPAVFVARVVFPSAGSWGYEVFDDFTSEGGQAVPCARTHTFEAVNVGGPAGGGTSTPPKAPAPVDAVSTSASEGGFPVWPFVGGALGALAVLAATALLRRRRRAEGTPGVAVH